MFGKRTTKTDGETMRKQKRICEVLDLLEQLWNKYSDQRLGQLLENYVFSRGHRGDLTSAMLFQQEDEETLSNLKAMLEKEGKG